MKRKLSFLLTAALIAVCCGLATCGTDTAALESLTITGRPSGDTVALSEGSLQLGFTFAPDNAEPFSVEWASDNQAVATVDKTGMVTLVSAGTAGISVKSTGGVLKEAIPLP